MQLHGPALLASSLILGYWGCGSSAMDSDMIACRKCRYFDARHSYMYMSASKLAIDVVIPHTQAMSIYLRISIRSLQACVTRMHALRACANLSVALSLPSMVLHQANTL